MIYQISKILDVTRQSYHRWKKEGRPIIQLLEKYFTKEDLQEFLDSGSITRLEKLDQSEIFVKSFLKDFCQKFGNSVDFELGMELLKEAGDNRKARNNGLLDYINYTDLTFLLKNRKDNFQDYIPSLVIFSQYEQHLYFLYLHIQELKIEFERYLKSENEEFEEFRKAVKNDEV